MRFFVIFFLSLGPVCAGIAFLTVVRPLRFGRAARISLGVVLLACSLKFAWFGVFGGQIFLPELPSRVIHVMSAGHDFVLVLAGFGVLWAVVRLVRQVFQRVLRRARPSGGRDEEIEQGLTRRRVISGALACVAAGVAAKGVHDGVRLPDVVEVELEFPDLPPAFDGYRIAHLSDLHISAAARADRTAGVVRLVNGCKPDLIAITGDFVDGSVAARQADVAPLAELHAPDGVVGCTGNHEYYSGWDAWRDVFSRFGVRVLENARLLVRHRRHRNQALAILGENDPVSHDSDIQIAAGMVPHWAFRILLAHRPTRLAEHAAYGVRLQLSGHTHGGAARGLDRFVARANEGHVRGIYREHGLTLYVNSGTGQWAGFPARLGVPPEITLLTLRTAHEAGGAAHAKT